MKTKINVNSATDTGLIISERNDRRKHNANR